MVDEFLVFIVKTVCINKHLLQIEHVLLKTVRHFLYLDKFVAVVLVKHALHANCHTALLAKVLDRFVRVTWAEDIGLTSFDCVRK